MTSSRSGIGALPLGAVEPAAHDRHRFLVIAQLGIERRHFSISISDHKFDLAHPALAQPRFSGPHQTAPKAATMTRGRDGEIINPAAMPVMTDHHAAGYSAFLLRCHEYFAVARSSQQGNIGGRRVPGPGQAAILP